MNTDDQSNPPRRPASAPKEYPGLAPAEPGRDDTQAPELENQDRGPEGSGDGKPAPLTTASDLPPDHGKPQDLQIDPLPKVEPDAGPIPPEPDHDHPPEKPRQGSGRSGQA